MHQHGISSGVYYTFSQTIIVCTFALYKAEVDCTYAHCSHPACLSPMFPCCLFGRHGRAAFGVLRAELHRFLDVHRDHGCLVWTLNSRIVFQSISLGMQIGVKYSVYASGILWPLKRFVIGVIVTGVFILTSMDCCALTKLVLCCYTVVVWHMGCLAREAGPACSASP